MTSRKDLLFTKHDQFTLHDFIPKKHEYMIPVVNRIIAINMLVNTYKYLLYEHRDSSLYTGFDSASPLMWYLFMRVIHSSDWAHYLNNWKAGSEAVQECESLEVETKMSNQSHEVSDSGSIDGTSCFSDC